jgi:hypothetical protein
MSSTLLWQGFDYSWHGTPHRLNQFGSILRDVVGSNDQVHGRYVSHFSPGNVPDRARADTLVSTVGAQALQAVHGAVTQRVDGVMGTAATVRGPLVQVPLPVVAGAALAAVPLLFGFDLKSDGKSTHTRGFGFRIADPRIDGNVVSFRPEYFLFPDRSPDPLTSDADRFAYDMTLAYAVLYGRADDVVLTDGVVQARADSAVEPLRLSVRVDGAPNRSHAAVGLRGFRWTITDARRQPKGRYLRRVVSAVEALRHEPSTGQAHFDARLLFSNDGLIAYDHHDELLLEHTLVQYDAGSAPVARRLTNELEVGQSEAEQPFTI